MNGTANGVNSNYDFIVVGGGPAGAICARRLADSEKRPRVLLLEAGGANRDMLFRPVFDRFGIFMMYPQLNWSYKSAPQKHLNNRIIDYARGKGLGGSSAINFVGWTIGPKADYDTWAKLVGDDDFKWENAQRRYSEMETYDDRINPELAKWSKSAKWHGSNGPLNVCVGLHAESDLVKIWEAAVENGKPINTDVNSGDPLGYGVFPNSSDQSVRTSAASAFLTDFPANLEIKTESQVTKLIFEGKKTVGVDVRGKQYFASKDVILSAGSIDSPKIMFLSGIGPKEDLEAVGIDCFHDLRNLGKHCQEHVLVPMVLRLHPGNNERASFAKNTAGVEKARQEWLKDPASMQGPFMSQFSITSIAFEKQDTVLKSKEFADLPKEAQEQILAPTTPTVEFIGGSPALYYPDGKAFTPDDSLIGVQPLLMVPQSRGFVKLASSDPAEPLIIDPNLLSHPFDKRVLIEGVREMQRLLAAPALKDYIAEVFAGPEGDSDEEILEYSRKSAIISWHISCTAKMGSVDDSSACLNSDFRVRGLENLRVVDLSAVPFTPNCHTQAPAYFIGATAAEKMIREYGLS